MYVELLFGRIHPKSPGEDVLEIEVLELLRVCDDVFAQLNHSVERYSHMMFEKTFHFYQRIIEEV